ncbi:hypothetical protein CYMTET_11938 [Cymbomonas tetramitiformis]|uniref:Uncharacterized protein n=1 Tax=Cymbomonas tetramitiformis TaxID=36881 RepID=A0AAE0GLL2_9CHLO|nr:hypothetical protein CYMTET_11938 [Cymbomonas tetramitiformis]|eukprot:gene16888-20065_t
MRPRTTDGTRGTSTTNTLVAWSDNEGRTEAAWEGDFRGCHSPPVDLFIHEPTKEEDLMSEFQALSARSKEHEKWAERLRENMAFTPNKLGRYRDDLHAVFDDKIRLAHELLPLLRKDLESHSHWGVNRVYELLFRCDLTRSGNESANNILNAYERADAKRFYQILTEQDKF